MKKIVWVKIIIAVVLCICISFSSISALAAAGETEEVRWLTFSELIKEKGFVSGAQQGWFISSSPGNDIGYSVRDGYARCNYSDEMFLKVIYDCKAMGFDILKTWLNYNVGGMRFDKDFRVVAIDQTYIENLEKIIKMAQEAGMYLCFSTFNHCEGTMSDDSSSYKYERIIQYLYNKNARQMVFENWLRPIIELTKKYPNVVAIDLYTEPEADGGGWGVPNGTSWSVMREFLKEQNDFIKSINPKLETYCSATYAPEELYDKYGGLGLDYYGYDFYNEVGSAHDTSELFLDAPLIYGEIGIKEGTPQKGDDFVSNFMSNYLTRALEKGVKAGFWWCYGFPGRGNMTLVDAEYRPRSAMVASRYWQLDRDYRLAGISPDMDKPSIAYSTNESIIWMGARGASSYRVERTVDGINWVEVLSFNAETTNKYEYSTLMYQAKDDTAEPGNKYYYRVVAINSEGKETVSDKSNIVDCKQVICSEEDNLIKNYSFEDESGFSTTPTVGKWYALSQSAPYAMRYITDGVEGEDTHTGTHSIFKPKRLYQIVNLEPHTDYTFTFFVKFTNKEGDWNTFGGLTVGTPSNDEWDIFESKYNPIMPYFRFMDEIKHGKWHRITYFFNSGEYTKVKVALQGHYTKDADSNADWYLDDFYLFKTK